MVRVKIIKDYKNFRAGDIKELSANEAFGLIDKMVAIVTKDMTSADIQIKSKEVKRAKKTHTYRKKNI